MVILHLCSTVYNSQKRKRKSHIFWLTETKMLPFVQIFCLFESVTKQENGVQISSQSVKLFLYLSCFLFYSFFRCICSKMICLNPGLIWVKLNSKQLCLRFWSLLIVKSVMRVDLSYIFQSDLVTRLKPNFRIEDVEATVL